MPDDPIPRPVNNTKQLILLLLIPLCGCSPTYVLKSNTTSRFDTLRVAFVPFFNVTGNYKEDKKGTGIAGYLQNGIAGRLGAASWSNTRSSRMSTTAQSKPVDWRTYLPACRPT